MALTSEDLKTLQRPFRYADHSFLRGFVYLSEEAITARLEEVDPSWTFEIINVRYEGSQAIVTARMTVGGVYRDGVGMQKINENAGEADKGAATDALKRAARLFGVGRYLLDAPSGDGGKPSKDFNEWLAKAQREAGITPPAPPTPSAPPANAVLETAAANGGKVSRIDKPSATEATWTEDEAKAFAARWQKQSVTQVDLFAALGVTRLGEWKQSRKAADEAVDRWLLDRINEPQTA